MVLKRGHDGVRLRQGVCYKIALSGDMPEVSTEMSNKLQVTELSWGAFIYALLENICEKLVICKDDKRAAFEHMSEVLDGIIYCQELRVVRTVLC